MNNLKNRVYAFTLVEVLVSITIFSIMFISIIWIYFITTDISMKSDINRMMYENIKNLSTKISEDIKKNWINWTSFWADTCSFDTESSSNKYIEWDKLCTNSDNKYYLAKQNLSWEYTIVSSSDCSWMNDHCVIAMWPDAPLTNSYVSVKNLRFYLSNDAIPKVTMNITLQPAIKKWVKSELIKENKIIFQTTISERQF